MPLQLPNAMKREITEPKHDPHWAKAKKICRLNLEDIRMAKALGMSPRTLMKNNPSPTQRWKLPVKLWIQELYAKRFGSKAAATAAVGSSRASAASADTAFEEDIPF